MKRNLTLFFAILWLSSFEQTTPKRELRGAWIATFSNIDWPSSGATTAQEQSTFIQRITEHKATGMNAVFVQIRSQCDAMYNSSFEPWSRDLTGTQGTAPNPYYDPLSFMIDETRKQGMEFHAWFNPYRALSSATATNLAALHGTHVINTNPSWILDCVTGTTTQKILNPGIPEVTDYIIKVVMDVVRRYDVDGIHMDDYFYPNPATTTYNDDATFATYSRGISNKNDWRRANIDSLVKRLGDSIRTVKPWIKYGFSPSGIWISSSTSGSLVNNLNTVGSNTSSGATQHYKDHFANSRLWQQSNWLDYNLPQVYWHQGQTGSDYNNLVFWWNNNAFNRHMYMGMASYKVGVASNGDFTTNNRQIPNQLRLNRLYPSVSGSVFYNTTSLRNNLLWHRDSLQILFSKPALTPFMSWKSTLTPNAPINLTATPINATTVTLNWTKAADGPSEFQKTRQFVVYRSTSHPVDINDANNLMAITNTDLISTYTDNTLDGVSDYFYVVTAVNRIHGESVVSNAVTNNPLPTKLQNFYVHNLKDNVATIKWTTSNELNVSHFELEHSHNQKDFSTIEKLHANNKAPNYYAIKTSFKDEFDHYYRLKIVENNGKNSYSKVLKIESKNNSLFKLLNNTIAKGGFLQFNTNNEVKLCNYMIVDASARVLQLGKLNNAGTIALAPTLQSGMYFVKIFHQQKTFTYSILIK